MFNIMKKLFRKTKNFENSEKISENQVITFNDLKAQVISIEVRQNGNNTILLNIVKELLLNHNYLICYSKNS